MAESGQRKWRQRADRQTGRYPTGGRERGRGQTERLVAVVVSRWRNVEQTDGIENQ